MNVNFYDSSGLIIDAGIDEIAVLPAGQIGFEHGDTFATSAATYRISSIDCFDY